MKTNETTNACPKCGAPVPAEAPQGLCPKCVFVQAVAPESAPTATANIPSLERLAVAFPQLQVIELIGRGGMGFVFKARQPHLDRFVALKLLPDSLAHDPHFAERFNREGRTLARLNHPNIVSIFDFGQAGGFYFLLMEYVDGVNLRQAMQAGRFSPSEALAIVPKICEALQFAHEEGVLHRDIKPENILLDAKGRVKIADFGIAKIVGEENPDVSLTATGAALGTPHYMAPEQFEKPATVDHRADIYSLGVVFYEMLTGELPIGRFSPPSQRTPLDPRVDDVVMRTLEKEREKRFQSAGEMGTNVEHLTEAGAGTFKGSTVPPKQTPSPATVPQRVSIRSWMRAIIWIVLVGCLINFLGLHMTRLGNSPASTFTVGLTQPWLANVPLLDANGIIHREFRFNFGSTAFLSGVIALLLGAALIIFRHKFRSHGSRKTIVVSPADVPPAVADWSQKAVWAAVLVGISLPLPLALPILLYLGVGAMPWAALVLATAVISLPGLAGTILGWMALSDLRAHQGRLRGLSLAVVAALAWPLILLVGVTLVVPYFIVHQSSTPGTTRQLSTFVMLLVPIGTITFAIWAVYAAARWGANQPASQRRGVLKWVFLGLLVFGVGTLVLTNLRGGRPVSEVPPSVVSADTNPTPWIRFTFTAVELREVQGVRWLAIDYLDDVHGECQKAFPWETTIPGFKAETRATEFFKEDKDSSPAVRHQRVEYRMPDSSPRDQLERLRDNLEKALKHKSFRLELGENEVPLLLFELPGAEGGSLQARIKVVPPIQPPTGQSDAVERRIRLAQQQLEAVEKIVAAGRASQQALLEARRDVEVAEARGDIVMEARAKMKFAENTLKWGQKLFESGRISSQEMRALESQHGIAEIDLQEALKRTGVTQP